MGHRRTPKTQAPKSRAGGPGGAVRIPGIGPVILTFVISMLSAGPAPAEPHAPGYDQVHAIFAKHCLACHDAKEADGELVMESHQKLLAGGESGAAVVPGAPERSLLMTLIEQKKKPFMPPPKKGAKLSDAEIDLIRRWIAAGAKAGEAGAAPPAKPVVLPRVAPIGKPRNPVHALAWSDESGILAAARHGAVELRSIDGSTQRTLGPIPGTVHDAAFFDSGRMLAAVGGRAGVKGLVTIWNTADGSLVRTFEGHADAIYSVAVGDSPQGPILATGSYDQDIKIWDVNTGKERRTLRGHNGAVFGLSLRPDGQVLASASADRTVKLWSIAAGRRLDTLTQPTREQQTVAFSPDGKVLAAAGADNRVRLWSVSSDAREGTNPLLESRFAHEGAILRLAWSPDGRSIATSAEDRSVKLWTAADWTLRTHLPTQPDWPTGLCLAMNGGQLVVGRLDGSIQRYDAATGRPLAAAAPIDADALAVASGKKPAKPKAAEKKTAADKAPAKPAPQITVVEPRGVRRGETSTIRITGKNLANITRITLPNPGIKAALAPDSPPSDAAVSIAIDVPADAPIGPQDLTIQTAAGMTKVKIHIDDLPQSSEREPNDLPAAATAVSLPSDLWGLLAQRGDVDRYRFEGRAGQIVVFDVAAGLIDSKADLQLTLADATGNLLNPQRDVEDDVDPLVSYRLPADGPYVLTVRDRQLGASADHFYRVTAGSLPIATGVHPLGVPVGQPTSVRLIGVNLPTDAQVTVHPDKPGETPVPTQSIAVRSRGTLKVLASATPELVEVEPNDIPARATPLPVPGAVSGRIMPATHAAAEADLFRLRAQSGRTLVLETTAARRGSPIDTRIEVLDTSGRPVPRLLLRALRDSAVTFRPIDANNGGARLVNWEEMGLNEYLYLEGEVVRLFQTPRGPDSEFGFYTISGKRRTYFDTSATAHPLDAAAYIVQPLPADAVPSPNGLPVFTVPYANDDDQLRKLGADSRIHFTPPADGDYLVRVTDSRGFAGDRFTYRLVVRPATPGFQASLNFGAITARSGSQNAAMRAADAAPPKSVTIPAGTGLSFDVNLDRLDDFDGPVRVEFAGLPSGFQVSSPLVVEAGHVTATGTIFVPDDTPTTPQPLANEVTITASAVIDGRTVTRQLTGFGALAVGERPKLTPFFHLDDDGKIAPPPTRDQIPVLTLVPGRLTPAWLSIQRRGFEERVSFDVLNLPHGVIVADIGLNGVLIPEKQTERRIFLQCEPWVADQDRLAYARTREGGNPTTRPVLIQVRRSPSQAEARP